MGSPFEDDPLVCDCFMAGKLTEPIHNESNRNTSSNEDCQIERTLRMKHFYSRSKCSMKNAAASEQGGSMVEYVLLVALIALGATAGMTSTANGVTTVMKSLSTTLSSAMDRAAVGDTGSGTGTGQGNGDGNGGGNGNGGNGGNGGHDGGGNGGNGGHDGGGHDGGHDGGNGGGHGH